VKIQTRIVLVFICAVALGFFLVMQWLSSEIKPHYRESAEETLVETAELLAPFAADRFSEAGFDSDSFRIAISAAMQRSLDVQIFKIRKTHVTARVYVTNADGLVVFDSEGAAQNAEGADYSGWNDVARTLRGEYGARSTRLDPLDPLSTVMYVAAPVIQDGKIIGSLTVAKTNAPLVPIIEAARIRLILAVLFAAMLTILFGLTASFWIGYPLKQLTRYARGIRDGQRIHPPRIGSGEIRELSIAFEEMRDALEGKKYTETYIRTLTHEIKSPLAAIVGASEILQEDLPSEQRLKFLYNLRHEAARIAATVDRLLELSALEGTKALSHRNPVLIKALLQRVTEQYHVRATARGVEIASHAEGDCVVSGEEMLLEQAVGNLLENALSFSPTQSVVQVNATNDGSTVTIRVSDSGPGIPAYAASRVFERFYSLPRPDSKHKGTGLGLSFVKQVAELHAGTVTLSNRTDGSTGALAVLQLPTAR